MSRYTPITLVSIGEHRLEKDTDAAIEQLRIILTDVSDGRRTIESALAALQIPSGLRASDHATTDLDRLRRRGIPEVIYGEGKTGEQIVEVLRVLTEANQAGLVTRASEHHLGQIRDAFPSAQIDAVAQCALVGSDQIRIDTLGSIVVISAGTSDLPVAAETVFCLKAFGNEVIELRDLGVSGLHRLMQSLEQIRKAQVVIAIPGFEAALPTVLGGLIDRPIVAVPTSVGYGTSFGGLTALLGMLNSCTPGMTVVNIDNGFGAAYAATQMNRMPRQA